MLSKIINITGVQEVHDDVRQWSRSLPDRNNPSWRQQAQVVEVVRPFVLCCWLLLLQAEYLEKELKKEVKKSERLSFQYLNRRNVKYVHQESMRMISTYTCILLRFTLTLDVDCITVFLFHTDRNWSLKIQESSGLAGVLVNKQFV